MKITHASLGSVDICKSESDVCWGVKQFSFYGCSITFVAQKGRSDSSIIWRLSKPGESRGPRSPLKDDDPLDLFCRYLFSLCWAVTLAVRPETLKWGLLWVWGWVRALAGAPESPTNFAAISQVWKLRCKNRSWNPVISVLLIAIPHARHSAEY